MKDRIDQKEALTIKWSIFYVLIFLFLFIVFIGFSWLIIDLIAPVFLAWLLAVIFQPMIVSLNKNLKFPKWLSVILILFILTIFVTGLVVWLMPLLVQQANDFIESIPDYIESIAQKLYGKEYQLSEDIDKKISDVAREPGQILPLLFRGSAKSLSVLAKTFNYISYLMIYLSLLLVFFIAFSLKLPEFKEWFWQFVPKSKQENVAQLSSEIYKVSATFMRTRLIIALILGFIFSVGWGITGVPYYLLLGVITGILNIIPYASVIGWIAVLIVNGLESQGGLFFDLLFPSLVFAVAQGIDGWILTPFLQGERLDLNPVIVFFAVIAGGLIFGLLGMLLAIPVIGSIRIIFLKTIKPRLLEWAKNN